MKMRQRGFTLPELLVAGGILALLFVAGAFMLASRVDVGAERRDAQRRLDVAFLVTTFKKYMADNQELPSGISSAEQFIGNAEGEFDLCAQLVPAYAQDLPFDPLSDLFGDAKTCPANGGNYSTGYSIQQKDDVIIFAAPVGETDQGIKIELDY